MVENNTVEWEKEPIENFLDEHSLFRGIHKNYLINWSGSNKIPPNIFSYKKVEKGLSTDWSKYATPQFTVSHLSNPDLKENGVLEINIGNLKETILKNDLLHSSIFVSRPQPFEISKSGVIFVFGGVFMVISRYAPAISSSGDKPKSSAKRWVPSG